MKKLLLFIVFSCLTSFGQSHSDLDQFFDRSVLKDKAKVQDILSKHNFEKVFFETPDNIKLCGLFLDQSKHIRQQVKGTIIFDTGFYPGMKEGIATFYTLLQDQPYNFLFFDARGHHESSGSFLNYQALKQYGAQEYLDVIGAINFVQEYGQRHNISKNIILHGICAGAHHNIKAANRCSCRDNIKGIVFDSGWNQISQVAQPVLATEMNKIFKNSYLSFLEKPINSLLSYFYNLCFRSHHETVDSLDNDISTLSCPIFFIHSTNDTYAPIQPAQTLAQKTKIKQTWWIDAPGHACSHLLYPTEYKEKLQTFCSNSFKS